jgi:hypothetical protein
MRSDAGFVFQDEQSVQHGQAVIALHIAQVVTRHRRTAGGFADDAESILFVDGVIAVRVADRMNDDIARGRADGGAGRY